MVIAPTSVKFLVLSLLGVVWMAVGQYATRLEESLEPYHIRADRRDRRKARFYFVSVWVGLAAIFLSLFAVELLSNVSFETTSTRSWVLGTLRGLGLWGLLIIAMVWSQVGQRVSQPNSDGTSLLPMKEEEKNRH